MITELARLDVRDPAGVFAARQLARGLAASLALDRQDQIRVATALSEISRSAVTAGRSAVIAFSIDDTELLLTVTLDGELPAEGIAAASRLMDTVAADGNLIRMAKRRPPDVRPDMRVVKEQLAAILPQSALEELRRQNQDLISALEDLRQQKEQLLLLNSELQETNRGVMALYSELSNELEQTNRGVVALYAELDETSKRLRAASESKDRFWTNVSHELRTPLNSIIGLTRLLAEPGPEGVLDSERLYQVELIRNSGSRRSSWCCSTPSCRRPTAASWLCTASCRTSLSRPTAAWSPSTRSSTRRPSGCAPPRNPRTGSGQIGRASCRERVCLAV